MLKVSLLCINQTNLVMYSLFVVYQHQILNNLPDATKQILVHFLYILYSVVKSVSMGKS